MQHVHKHFKGDCDIGNYIPSYSDFILALKNPNKVFKIETPVCVYVLEFVCENLKCSNYDFLFKRVWKDILRDTFSNEQKICSERSKFSFEQFINFVDSLNIKLQIYTGHEEIGFDLKIYF